MKFDFCVGNPPYQQETSDQITTNGQKSRKNIFHYFQIGADQVSKVGSVMIYPGGRWIHQSGKGLQEFGHDQMNDPALSSVTFYPDAKEIFGNAADLSDGVTVVIKSKQKKSKGFQYNYVRNGQKTSLFVDNPGDDLMPLNPNDYQLVRKIAEFVNSRNLDYLHNAILPRSLFGIESDFVSKNKKAVRLLAGNNFDPAREIKLFTNDKAGKSGRATWFIADRSVIQQNRKYINEWQVVVSSANAGGQKRDNQLEIIDNHSAFGRSRVALRSFKNKKEAENFFKYVSCKTIRYCFLLTDEALTTLGLRVPDLKDYSNENTIIDFDQDIDSQLYKMMNLSNSEITYLESVIENLRKKG